MAGTIRHFDGGREKGRMGAASEIMRIEIMKKGKLPAADRYRQIVKKQFDEHKKKALGNISKSAFSLPGTLQQARKMSRHAELKLKELSEKKARKEAKALRKMVLVEPRRFSNGNIDRKGNIYDIAGNLVGKVNTKNGSMLTSMGTYLGKYKPKSYFTNLTIESAITLHSPHFINLRKQQLAMQQGVQTITVHGPMATTDGGVYGGGSVADINYYGVDASPARQNIAATAWGVRSDNVWGSFADTTWGTFADNVWGGNYSDVWGGVGAGNLWGNKGPNIFGTGNGHNFLRGFTNAIAALFGFSTKQNRERLRALNAASGRSSRTANARTAAAPSGGRSGR